MTKTTKTVFLHFKSRKNLKIKNIIEIMEEACKRVNKKLTQLI